MYHSDITVNLVSAFRWKDSGWKRPDMLRPDMTVVIKTHECLDAHKRITIGMDLGTVTVHGELSDPSLEQGLASAVLDRCRKDFKVLETFGGRLRSDTVRRNGSPWSGNMFADTDYLVNFQHVYTFMVALDSNDSGVTGAYLVPSFLPAPVDSAYDEDPFYRMSCYERFV